MSLVPTGQPDEILLNASLRAPRNPARRQRALALAADRAAAKAAAKPQEKAARKPLGTTRTEPQKGCQAKPQPVARTGRARRDPVPAPVPVQEVSAVREDSAVRQLVFLLFLAAIFRAHTPRASTGPGEKMEDVACDVLARHGVSLAEIRGPRRAAALVAVRFEAQYEVRARCRVSASEMGRFFHRDHTSILSATDRWAERNRLPKPWKAGRS